MDPITNDDNIIDSRDVIARIEELSEILTDGEPTLNDHAEYNALRPIADAAEWQGGELFIRESYFERYCREYLIDQIPDGFDMSVFVIDWEATARDALTEYSKIEYNGVTYYIR